MQLEKLSIPQLFAEIGISGTTTTICSQNDISLNFVGVYFYFYEDIFKMRDDPEMNEMLENFVA